MGSPFFIVQKWTSHYRRFEVLPLLFVSTDRMGIVPVTELTFLLRFHHSTAAMIPIIVAAPSALDLEGTRLLLLLMG